MLLMASFTLTEPRLPPITRSTGFSPESPAKESPASLEPERSSRLMGEPVRTALSFGRYFIVSGKLQHMRVAEGMLSLLASPGVMSDSWDMTGTL